METSIVRRGILLAGQWLARRLKNIFYLSQAFNMDIRV